MRYVRLRANAILQRLLTDVRESACDLAEAIAVAVFSDKTKLEACRAFPPEKKEKKKGGDGKNADGVSGRGSSVNNEIL